MKIDKLIKAAEEGVERIFNEANSEEKRLRESIKQLKDFAHLHKKGFIAGWLAFCVFGGTIIAVNQKPEPAKSDPYRDGLILDQMKVACHSEEVYARISAIGRTNDDAAFRAAIRNGVITGRCKLIEKGTRLRIDQYKTSDSHACVSPWGSSENCMWTYLSL